MRAARKNRRDVFLTGGATLRREQSRGGRDGASVASPHNDNKYSRKTAANSAGNNGRAWIELDMDNLRHNVRLLQGLLPEGCLLMPAVKANAYGHGLIEISKELSRLGIRAFCVASAGEGIQLRKHGIEGEILVLGYTSAEQFDLLKIYDLTQTVLDGDYGSLLNSYGKKMKVHIKVDTGMNRLGARAGDLGGILRIFGNEWLDVRGIYTHLCAADGGGAAAESLTRRQIESFRGLLAELERRGVGPVKAHVLGSYGVFRHAENAYDYARVGIALYGMLSLSEETERYGAAALRPVLSLKARISAVKTVNADENVGYGLAFTAARRMRIAVLSIGYADGVPRGLSCGVGSVLVGGRRAPVVGRVCMDQMTVDVTGIENVRQGDAAVLIGGSGAEQITACEVAERTGTIANEILSRLGERVTRIEGGAPRGI